MTAKFCATCGRVCEEEWHQRQPVKASLLQWRCPTHGILQWWQVTPTQPAGKAETA